jgi:hypothetical protein
MSQQSARFLITGWPRAGKSTLLGLLTPHLQDSPESGFLEVNANLRVEFITAQAHPSEWRERGAGCLGGVWVLDGEQDYRYEELWPSLKQLQSLKPLPLIVAVNRRCDPTTLEAIRAYWPPSSEMKLFPLGQDSASAHNVLIALIYQLLG